MKNYRKWILMSIIVCSVLALVYPGYAALGKKPELRSIEMVECPKGDDYFFVLIPNPDDCREYYECYNGIPIAQRCPENLYFCPQKSYCAWLFEDGCVFDCVIP